MPEDLAKLHALWSWQREHCPSCNQRRTDWVDDDGVELRDPPFEIALDLCPSCGWLEDWDEENPKKDRNPGERPYIRRVDDDVLHPGDGPDSTGSSAL